MQQVQHTGHRRIRLPSAFPGGVGKIPNNPVIAAAIAAILNGGARARCLRGGWCDSDDGTPIYRLYGRKGGCITISIAPDRANFDGASVETDPWSLVERLSPFTADIAFAILAQICEPSTGNKSLYPIAEPVRITADAILGYVSIKRWGVERQRLRKRIRQEIQFLQALKIDIQEYPAWDPMIRRWNSNGISVSGDRLFDVSLEETYQPANGCPHIQPNVAWLVRFGQWGDFWMNSRGRVWTGPILQSLLELDHRENRGAELLAKRIGEHMILLSVVVRNTGTMERRIDHLLESVGELPEEESRGAHWAGRIRDRFDEAMLTLREIGLFESVAWSEGYGPGDSDRNKGWVHNWLSSKVAVLFAPTLWAQKKSLLGASPAPANDQRPGKSTRKPLKQPGPGKPTVRRIRAENGWSQKILATKLGISASYLSQIENGNRQPSQVLQDKIRTLLDNSASPSRQQRL